MLADVLTGQEREVDVTVTKKVAGYPVTVAIEATAAGEKATVNWVEQLVAKHSRLLTSKLVLVSQAGFWATAKDLALQLGALPLEPEDLSDDDPSLEIVNRLDAIWAKTVSLNPQRVRVWVTRPDGSTQGPIVSTPDLDVVLEDGLPVAPLGAAVQAWVDANMRRIQEQIGIHQIDKDLQSEFILEVSPWTARIDGRTAALCLHWTGEDGSADERHPVSKLQVVGRAAIEVVEVELKHARLGEAHYSHGEATILGRRSLVVITEDEEGGRLTVRQQDEGPKP